VCVCVCACLYMLCGNIRVERTTPELDSTEAPLGRIHLPHGAVMIPLLIKDCVIVLSPTCRKRVFITIRV
jgi:hypothetical protein